jgi:hypothetical protein
MSESTSSDNPAPGTDQARQEAELIGRIIQSEQKLSDYFTTIPGMLSWVRGTIAEQTEHALGAQFDLATTQLEARFEDFLDQERMYSSFTNHLLYLSERRSVPRSEMTELRVRLEELAKYPSIIARAEFPYLADLVVRLAVKQGDKATLEPLETDLSSVLTSVRTKPRLARYYGERVLGADGEVFRGSTRQSESERGL